MQQMIPFCNMAASLGFFGLVLTEPVHRLGLTLRPSLEVAGPPGRAVTVTGLARGPGP